jgi:hypothetical protein
LTLRRIAKLSGSQTSEPANSTDGETRPITAEAVDLGGYPGLQQRCTTCPATTDQHRRSALPGHASNSAYPTARSSGSSLNTHHSLTSKNTRHDTDRVIRAAR